MTLDEVKRHEYFTRLSPGKKVFVVARCEGDDLVAAANRAWNAKDDASATTMGNRAMRDMAVAWLISQFYGAVYVPTREELADKFIKRAQGAADKEAVAFYTLAVDILGYRTKPAAVVPLLGEANKIDGDEQFNLD